MKQVRTQKTRWWKLNEEEHQHKFVQEVEKKLGEEEQETWSTLSNVVQETGEVLGRTSGKKEKKEEICLWCTEVQEVVKEKKERKALRHLNGRARRSKKSYQDRKTEEQRSTGCLPSKERKDSEELVLREDNQIREWWKEYYQQLMNVENPRVERVIEAVEEREVEENKGDIQDCGIYQGIKLTSHTLKVWERIIDKRLRKRVKVSEQQFSLMPNRITADGR
ncbi:golgin subfamily A member 6-like protein 22 [Penaeus chinensis]|uniref:golgin subfamily A member 6-like protein 22 n=1 Tax=Penaeus chinensis TaxID=139456 RepID=UPI001FB59ABE|nr:golgin subfamily A member 6-like protein 22 [Penaeus chinensis]